MKDREATQTGGVETMIHRRGVYQYPMMIMFIGGVVFMVALGLLQPMMQLTQSLQF